MTRRGIVLFAAMSVIWGIPYLLIRITVAEISPALLVFSRTAIGAALLLPIAFLRVDLRPVLRHWRWIIAFAAIEIAIPWLMLGAAEQAISSSLAGLLVAGVPLVGAAIAAIVGGPDRVGRRQLVGLLIGFAGVAVIAGGDFDAKNTMALIQVAIVVVCYALGPFILSRRLNGVPTLGIMALALTLTAVFYAPVALVSWPATQPSADALASIVILAVVCTAAAFLLFAALIKEVGPVRATVITYVNPVVAATLGVLILSETLTLPMLVGFALAIAGSTLATRRPNPSDAGAAAAELAESAEA
ncbi:MAG: EamA family transporter [Chloroflexota bacterium]|jgi:drug/metabolite transporter (DMT)-like permease|nr:EamA family transporter [Chloroflexota bacterium]MDH5242920.1 EamA family transporter [Chloroflexota bacterium]